MPVKSIYGKVEIVEKPLHDVMRIALSKNAINFPGKPALIDSETGKKLSFEDINYLSANIATYLHGKGLTKNDSVLVCLQNCIEFSAIILGISGAGGIYSGINPNSTKNEIFNQMLDCDCKYIFTADNLLTKLLSAIKQLPTGQIQEVIAFRYNKAKKLPENVTDFVQLTNNRTGKWPKIDYEPKNDVVMLPYSSGTTGKPKGIMLTHYNIVSLIKIRERFYQVAAKYFSYATPTINFLPFYHMYGYYLLMIYLNLGITQVVMSKFHFEKYLQLIEEHKPSFLLMVPPVLVLLAKHSLVDKHNLSSVKYIQAGGAPLGKEICDGLKARLPNVVNIVQGYSLTEMSAVAYIPLPGKTTPGSVGFVASNTESMIMDVDSGKELGPMENGEIWLRGPQVMKGYWKSPRTTAEVIDENGWFHTGDIGYHDERNCLFVVDRIKELIKVKGFQVAPAELEHLLLSHPDIQDCAVVGVPDLLFGELPRAYVVLKRGKTASGGDIEKFVRDKVIYYKQLKGGVEFVSEIPKIPSGKILRRTLKDKAKIHSKL